MKYYDKLKVFNVCIVDVCFDYMQKNNQDIENSLIC